MVTEKKRRSKGETYVYLSVSVTRDGDRKVFERSLGPIGTDRSVMERRRKFQTELLELKKQFYLT